MWRGWKNGVNMEEEMGLGGDGQKGVWGWWMGSRECQA